MFENVAEKPSSQMRQFDKSGLWVGSLKRLSLRGKRFQQRAVASRFAPIPGRERGWIDSEHRRRGETLKPRLFSGGTCRLEGEESLFERLPAYLPLL